ncbi:UNVERIFIED_CONTAM: hypothetical protein PYX00_002560 [Menopon gallinae]|uniref:Uncharacterized protein n=1 Tax=Menopon gallinae TaxID=328185 RepID=A0AAW2IJ93_9NEOP
MWAMTERTRSRIQAAEGLRVEPLLLHIDRSVLRWFGQVSRLPPTRLLKTSPIGVPGEKTTPRPSAAGVVQEGEGFSREPTGNPGQSERNRRGSGRVEVPCCLSGLATQTDKRVPKRKKEKKQKLERILYLGRLIYTSS